MTIFRTGPFLVKVALYVVCVLVFVGSVLAIVQTHEWRLLAEFEALRAVDPIPRAKELADAGEYCEALEYLDHLREYPYARDNPDVTMLYEEIKTKREEYLFRLKDVWAGVWKGKGACLESLVSATVSDFLIVGDVRDLVWETIKKYHGEDADEFTMALAGAGILLTGVTVASTPATGGTAAPVGVTAKVTVSLLKLAKRMGKLPASLQKSLIKVFQESRRTKSLKPLAPLSGSIYRISRVEGLTVRDFMSMMSRSKSIKDVKFMEQVASTYGKQTGKFLRLGADAPVEALRKFGKTPDISKAVDTAIQFGPQGSRLLLKTGPSKFLKYVTFAKYGERTVRSIWQQRLTSLLGRVMRFLPDWSLVVSALLSGLVVAGVPVLLVVQRFRRSRSAAGRE